MTPRRTLIIVVAIAIAAVAAVANVLYLNGVQDRANNHAKLLRVYAVAKDIPKGTTGEDAIGKGFIKTSSIPAKFRPATALNNINVIRGKVALTNLSTGQVLVDGQFVEPIAAQVTFSQRIPVGQVAISVNFDAVRAVDNLLVPGDKVDMIVTIGGQQTPAARGQLSTATEQFLFQNVNIIAIGSTAAPQPGETQSTSNPGSGTITFAVPPIAAEKIILASQSALTFGGGGGGGNTGGSIYLALVPPDNQPTPIPPVDGTNLLTGGLTPYA